MDRTTRRRVLSTSGLLLATALAGCSSSEDDGTTAPGATDAPDDTATPTNTATATATATDAPTEPGPTTVTVAPGGDLRFSPAAVTVSTGDTVEWVWDAGGHNVVADSTPDGTEWSGTDGAPTATYAAGHTYTHTFDIAGEYTYYCDPHRGRGMTGSITVE